MCDLVAIAAKEIGCSEAEVLLTLDFQGNCVIEKDLRALDEIPIEHGTIIYASLKTSVEDERIATEEEGVVGTEEGIHQTVIQSSSQQSLLPSASKTGEISISEDNYCDEQTRKLIEQLQKEDELSGLSSSEVRAPDPSRRINLMAPDPIDERLPGGTRWLDDDVFDPLRYGVQQNFVRDNPVISSSSSATTGSSSIIDPSVARELMDAGVSEYDLMLMTQRYADEEVARSYQQVSHELFNF